MNFLRQVERMGPPISTRSFSESSKKNAPNFFINSLSLINKARKTAFKLAIYASCSLIAYGFYTAHQEYENFKKMTFNPFSKIIEKIGNKEPQVKKEDLSDKANAVFRSILASDPLTEEAPLLNLNDLKTFAPTLLIHGIRALEKQIALPVKDSLEHPTPYPDIKSALSALGRAGETRILHELEKKKEELKDEINK